MDKFTLQEGQYTFPYHHIPYETDEGEVSLVRALPWGLEYLVYQQVVRQRIADLQPRAVLEVGCGDGRLIGSLGGIATRCLGVDLSERAIAFARAFFPGVDFRVADVATLSEAFDVVVAVEVLEHIPDGDLASFMSATLERVKAGGHLVVSVPTTCLPVNKKHFRHYDMELLIKHVTLGSRPIELVSAEFVFRSSFLYSLLTRLCFNRFWALEINAWKGFLWRIALRHAKADASSGRHLVAVFNVP